jgi:hypothetical protein
MQSISTRSDAAREARARRALARDGYTLRKDRAKSLTLDHQGGYMVIDPFKNFIIGGSRYNWDLDDVETWLAS